MVLFLGLGMTVFDPPLSQPASQSRSIAWPSHFLESLIPSVFCRLRCSRCSPRWSCHGSAGAPTVWSVAMVFFQALARGPGPADRSSASCCWPWCADRFNPGRNRHDLTDQHRAGLEPRHRAMLRSADSLFAVSIACHLRYCPPARRCCKAGSPPAVIRKWATPTFSMPPRTSGCLPRDCLISCHRAVAVAVVQGQMWSFGFADLAMMIATIRTVHRAAAKPIQAAAPVAPVSIGDRLVLVALSRFRSVSLSRSISMSTDVAAASFLWVARRRPSIPGRTFVGVSASVVDPYRTVETPAPFVVVDWRLGRSDVTISTGWR